MKNIARTSSVLGEFEPYLDLIKIPRCPTCFSPNPRALSVCPVCGTPAPRLRERQHVDGIVLKPSVGLWFARLFLTLGAKLNALARHLERKL